MRSAPNGQIGVSGREDALIRIPRLDVQASCMNRQCGNNLLLVDMAYSLGENNVTTIASNDCTRNRRSVVVTVMVM